MKILSLGLGVQSSTLYFKSSLGIVERCDYAIFADPKAESQDTYDYLEYLKDWQTKNNGIEIITASKGNLLEDLIKGTNSTKNKFAPIPAFTKNQDGTTGILRRQCTNEYKIIPIDKKIKELCGIKKYQRMKEKVTLMIGISLDEIERMKTPREKWKIFEYPLINLRMTRTDCRNYLIKNNFKIPPKSACEFCPFQTDKQWLKLKENKPEVFQAMINIDAKIRDSSKKGVKNPIYLHPSCKPLSEVKFKNETNYKLFQDFKNDCSGNCGV